MRSGSNSFALSNISLTIVTLPAPACQVLRITDDIELNLSCTGWTKRAFPIVQWCSLMNSFDEEMKSLSRWCAKMSYLEQFMRCFTFHMRSEQTTSWQLSVWSALGGRLADAGRKMFKHNPIFVGVELCCLFLVRCPAEVPVPQIWSKRLSVRFWLSREGR